MRSWAKGMWILVALVLVSCATTPGPQTLDQAKKGLHCIECQEGMTWTQVREGLGPPDLAPLPEPGGDLSQNTRIYQEMSVLFHIDRQEVGVGDEAEFQEVVTKIELCRKKQ